MSTSSPTEKGGQSNQYATFIPGFDIFTSIWHRRKAPILDSTSRITHDQTQPSDSLPYELIEMIINPFVHDIPTLKVCALVCRSWYTVVVPYIHHTFIYTGIKPLSKMPSKLFALVKDIRILLPPPDPSNPVLYFPNHRDSQHFSHFTHIQSMMIQHLDLQPFFPDVDRHFGHLAPTLRSLTLEAPRCGPLRLAHLFSLFPNLDDIEIGSYVQTAGALGEKLVPLSTPTLRGRLTIRGFSHIEIWQRLAKTCGMRFHSIYLHPLTQNATVFLPACAETLETLWIESDETNWFYLRTLVYKCDLSHLKVLRSLQIKAPAAYPQSSPPQEPPVDIFTVPLEAIFSKITSPVFSEVVIANPHSDIPDRFPWHICDVLRRMYETRPFKLVFLLIVPGGSDEEVAEKMWGEAMGEAIGKGLLSFLESPPSVRVTRR